MLQEIFDWPTVHASLLNYQDIQDNQDNPRIESPTNVCSMSIERDTRGDNPVPSSPPQLVSLPHMLCPHPASSLEVFSPFPQDQITFPAPHHNQVTGAFFCP